MACNSSVERVEKQRVASFTTGRRRALNEHDDILPPIAIEVGAVCSNIAGYKIRRQFKERIASWWRHACGLARLVIARTQEARDDGTGNDNPSVAMHARFASVTFPKILALTVALSMRLCAQWSEPVRVAALSTEADEFAPAWSPSDSTLYFTRFDGKRLLILAWRHCPLELLPSSPPAALDTLGDSIVYVSFAKERWVGQRYVLGKRQRYAELVGSALPVRRASAAVPLAEINRDGVFAMFPALSPDGERLAFAATDGEQDTTTDLWMSQWMQNHWSAPYRFDGFEQSPSSEITPCFLGRDSLLFASDGFGGKGGFDLFVTVEHAGTWTSPVPLEELNSAADDRDVCVLPNGDLLFASNRAGTFDLYYAQRRKKGRSQ